MEIQVKTGFVAGILIVSLEFCVTPKCHFGRYLKTIFRSIHSLGATLHISGEVPEIVFECWKRLNKHA